MKTFCKTTILILILLTSASAFAQQSGVKGVVKDVKNGELLLGTHIIVLDVEGKAAVAGMDGDFSIQLEPGNYRIKFSFVSYKDTILPVTVEKGKMTEMVVPMFSTEHVLASGEIVATRIVNSETATVQEVKNEDQVVNVIGSAEISKTASTTSADVARKIPGVTVIDNRFVIVRGLSERYNAVMINNALVPSLETDVKTFSFDIIPSGAIERFMVYKSPSADLPGEFSGGAIRIYTSSFPEKSGISVSYSSSFRTGTTGQNFLVNPGSSTDRLGFDNGFRALPADFPASLKNINNIDDIQNYGLMLKNTFNYDSTIAIPDQRFGFGINHKWNISKNSQLGTIFSLSYSQTRQQFISNRLDYNTFNETSGHSDTIFYYQDNINQLQSRAGIMNNWGYRFHRGGKSTAINLNNFLNQSGMNETTVRQGPNYEEGSNRKEYAYRWTQRTIFTSQLNGEHSWEKDEVTVNKIDWTAGYSLTRRNDPDWRRVRYTQALGSDDPYTAYIPFTANPFFLGRIFIDMNEDIAMGAANYEHVFIFKDKHGITKNFKPKVKTGVYFENKTREFNVRNIGYKWSSIFSANWDLTNLPVDSLLAPENINNQTGFSIAEDTKKSDSYDAVNNLRAYYLMAELPFKKFNATGGIRIENNLQGLYSGSISGKDTVIIENQITRVLPSVNIVYKIIDTLNKTLQLRGAYGRTLNRPEFRELAPLTFYDFVFNSIYVGNQNLKTPSIDNYEFRLEYYPSPSEMISAGFFYKDFTNPIETYFVQGVGSGGTRSFTFDNAPKAVSYGVEFDVRKSLEKTKIPFIKDLTIVANYSIIKSEIKLAEDASSLGVNQKRPMMGQSPYIFNGGLYYQNDSIGLGVSVMFNRIGERVVIVGIPDIPEVYEMPRSLLDLTVTKTIGKYFTLRFTVQDLLNQNFILLQDANGDGKLDKENDQRIQYYNRGSYYTLGFQFRLNYPEKDKK